MILLLGGTSESRQIAAYLQSKNIEFIISTVSKYGAELAREVSSLVHREAFDSLSLELFCQKHNITHIVDATHPFAMNISQLAINLAKKLHIQYVRYERKGTDISQINSQVYMVESIDEACQVANKLGNRILLTVGSKQLANFIRLLTKKDLYVRVLPDLASISNCLDLGITPNKIIALQGPFSKEFDKALIQEKKIDLVISKDSGLNGGADNKVAACLELGIPLILLKRPKIVYPCIINEIEKIFEFIQEGKDAISS